ncbi:hypothetical protein [uncultured Proteiniphilum sp.]|uniref:hypothetical protein n=1 Tax=uncultured Proteiniphilum sp. TaxID=497637 RepID=UPI00262A0312|nr:hypothetical protein [uncultured Proteiniphilum sp.]
MKFILMLLVVIQSLSACKPENDPIDQQSEPEPENIIYNNITATDGLNRTLPSWEEIGDPREKKYVGLFYWTWHTQQSNYGNRTAYDVTKILSEHPDAIENFHHPAWPKDANSYFWGEPLYGYYLNTDRWVLRKHAELLALAGVDVIIFDCTNGNFTWKESYMALCDVFSEARRDGVNTPQIAFLLAFGPTQGSKEAIEEIYRDLYKPGKYKDLFFMWKGKPLVMAYPDNLPEEIRNYFTFRPGQPTYNSGPARDDQWGWLEIYPQHGYAQRSTGYEQVPVGVAQNWSAERGLTAMNAPNSFGRSYTNHSGQIEGADAVNHGYNFQEQWERALKLDPQFVFVTGWNEWIAGRYEMWQQQYNAFPDEFSQEKSRDIEPMKGGHGDAYYYQLAANIRRFKGVGRIEVSSGELTVTIDGKMNEWEKVKPVYHIPRGNTLHRNHPGWAGIQFTNTSGRNDFVSSRVAKDSENLYFLIETAENITSSSDPGWMWLFIDADRNRETGWEGYDFILNRIKPSETVITVERNRDGWEWEKCGEATYKISGKQMEISIPRSALSFKDKKLNFEFKWTDNIQEVGDIMDFYLSGDVAPAGRFNFIYQEK